MSLDKEDIIAIAILKNEVDQLKRERQGDKVIIDRLQKWHDACTTSMLVWASICAAGMTMVTFIVSNWEKASQIVSGYGHK